MKIFILDNWGTNLTMFRASFGSFERMMKKSAELEHALLLKV
jgi:hypothetical protein